MSCSQEYASWSLRLNFEPRFVGDRHHLTNGQENLESGVDGRFTISLFKLAKLAAYCQGYHRRIFPIGPVIAPFQD